MDDKRPSKELMIARERDKVCVAPNWLRECEKKESRVDEAMFPFTHIESKGY